MSTIDDSKPLLSLVPETLEIDKERISSFRVYSVPGDATLYGTGRCLDQSLLGSIHFSESHPFSLVFRCLEYRDGVIFNVFPSKKRIGEFQVSVKSQAHRNSKS